jgi:hypothetical protein
MVLFRSTRLSQTGRYLDTIPPCRYLVEFARRARNITTLGALATQFHEECGLDGSSQKFQKAFREDGHSLVFGLDEVTKHRGCGTTTGS